MLFSEENFNSNGVRFNTDVTILKKVFLKGNN